MDLFDLYWEDVRVQLKKGLGEKMFGTWCWMNPEEEMWRERRGKRRKLGAEKKEKRIEDGRRKGVRERKLLFG